MPVPLKITETKRREIKLSDLVIYPNKRIKSRRRGEYRTLDDIRKNKPVERIDLPLEMIREIFSFLHPLHRLYIMTSRPVCMNLLNAEKISWFKPTIEAVEKYWYLFIHRSGHKFRCGRQYYVITQSSLLTKTPRPIRPLEYVKVNISNDKLIIDELSVDHNIFWYLPKPCRKHITDFRRHDSYHRRLCNR